MFTSIWASGYEAIHDNVIYMIYKTLFLKHGKLWNVFIPAISSTPTPWLVKLASVSWQVYGMVDDSVVSKLLRRVGLLAND